MNESKRNQIHRYFQMAESECQTQIAVLQADDRFDEAVFVKICLNVFDIFHAAFSSGEKTAGDNEDKLAAFFSDRLARIPLSWKTALEKAEQHDNMEAAYIERIKLDVVRQIDEAFCCIWEGKT